MMTTEFSFHKPPPKKITEWNANATKYSYALRNLLLCFCIDGSRKHMQNPLQFLLRPSKAIQHSEMLLNYKPLCFFNYPYFINVLLSLFIDSLFLLSMNREQEFTGSLSLPGPNLASDWEKYDVSFTSTSNSTMKCVTCISPRKCHLMNTRNQKIRPNSGRKSN